jgi:hypothetical protein
MNRALNGEGTKIRRDEILDTRCENTDREINNRRIVGCKAKEKLQKNIYD